MSAGPNVNLTPSNCNNIYIRERPSEGREIDWGACRGRGDIRGSACISSLETPLDTQRAACIARYRSGRRLGLNNIDIFALEQRDIDLQQPVARPDLIQGVVSPIACLPHIKVIPPLLSRFSETRVSIDLFIFNLASRQQILHESFRASEMLRFLFCFCLRCTERVGEGKGWEYLCKIYVLDMYNYLKMNFFRVK